MWSGNESNNQGAGDNYAGGGGFVSSQGGGGFDSPAGGGGDKSKTRRSTNIVPVTVKQLLECTDENVTVAEVEASMVTILGVIVGVEQTTTKLSMHVDDQTGVIECVNYTGSEDGTSPEVPFVPAEGSYGRIVGALRQMKGTKYLVIFRFFPVTDMNELTAHVLEVVQVAMKLKKINEAEKTADKSNFNALNGSLIMSNTFGPGVAGMMGGSGAAGGAHTPNNVKSPFSAIQKTVLNIIQSNKSEAGIHKDDIMLNLGGNIPIKDLEKLLEELGQEGHVYSTVDDDHFKSTD